MALVARPQITEVSGYTLIETLVALVIFTSVLLPLSGMIAALMIDQRPRQLQNALDEARLELCTPLGQDTTGGATVRMAKGLVIRRDVRPFGIFADIKVTVSPASDPGRILLVMHRTLFTPSPSDEPLKYAEGVP